MSARGATLPEPAAQSDSDDALQQIVVRCMDCGATDTGAVALTSCASCGGLLDVVVPLGNRVSPADIGVGVPDTARHSGVWRYWPLLPHLPASAIVSAWEGNTPLYRDDRLARFAGLPAGHLELKHEGMNPTGSFKDRGMTVGVSHARAIGARIVACASTGNTSASLAAYASAAGMPSLVLVPEGKISGGKLAQTIAYGATVVQIAGDFDAALSLLRLLTAKYDVYLVNSVNPARLQGQKTAAFEVVDFLGDAPDFHLLPVGNAGNIAAYWLGWSEYAAAGRATKRPVIRGFQAAGAAPLVEGAPVANPETKATAIRIGNPASWKLAEAARDESGGRFAKVSDEQILAAQAELARRDGVFVEPASAAGVAGLLQELAAGESYAGTTVVITVTGHGLKDTATALEGKAALDTVIDAEVDAAAAAAGLI